MSFIPVLVDLYNRAKNSLTLFNVFNAINIATAAHLALRNDPKNEGVVTLEAYTELAIPKVAALFPNADEAKVKWFVETVWDVVNFIKGQKKPKTEPVDQVG
jgi:hypothetical protein